MRIAYVYILLFVAVQTPLLAEIVVDTIASSCNSVVLEFRSTDEITNMFTQGIATDIEVLDTLPNTVVRVEISLFQDQLVGEATIRLMELGASEEFVHTHFLDARLVPIPILQASSLEVCEGEKAVLSLNGSFASYEWSNGATSATIAVGGGTYNVRVSTLEGCVATTEVTISELPSPPRPFIQNLSRRTVLCFGESVELSTLAASYERIVWSNGATTASIAVTSSGNYTVTGFNALGCHSTSESVRIQVLPAPLNIVEHTSGVYTIRGGHASHPVSGQFLLRNESQTDVELQLEDVQFAANVEFSVPPSQFPLTVQAQSTATVVYTFLPLGNRETSDILTVKNGCRDILYTFAGIPERNVLQGVGTCNMLLSGDVVDRRIFASLLAPSVASEEMRFETTNSGEVTSIDIVFIQPSTGNTVKSMSVEVASGHSSHSLSIANLPAGLYVVVMSHHTTVTQTIVKL